MKKVSYIPIIKTADAELRAVEYLSETVKSGITPLFELTRSRRTKNLPGGDIYRRLQKLESIYEGGEFILDLNGEYTNEQIEELQSNKDGYKKWVEFVIQCQETFPKLIPAIQVSDEDVDTRAEYNARLRRQAHALEQHFERILYRFPITYNDFGNDLEVICSALDTDKLFCIVDADFISPRKFSDNASRAIEIIEALDGYDRIKRVGIAATSFPKSPTQYGLDDWGEFLLEECLFYREVKDAKHNVIYGDYATINTEVNDQAGGSGWIPRIDVPCKETLFYYRLRRGVRDVSYVSSYIKVAQRIVQDPKYQEVKRLIPHCWGIKQIDLAAEGAPPGLSPSFWISVRMNIHITLRHRLLQP